MNTPTNSATLPPMAGSASPVTYRELHEEAAGMGLDGSFFAVSQIDPNAPVKCNCNWNDGHEEHCDIVAANRILMSRQNVQGDGSPDEKSQPTR